MVIKRIRFRLFGITTQIPKKFEEYRKILKYFQ